MNRNEIFTAEFPLRQWLFPSQGLCKTAVLELDFVGQLQYRKLQLLRFPVQLPLPERYALPPDK